jgi:hypothetical protein
VINKVIIFTYQKTRLQPLLNAPRDLEQALFKQSWRLANIG